jgi:hypothetical protein
MRRLIVLAVAAALVTTTVAGCSDDEPTDDEPTTTTAPPETTTTTEAPLEAGTQLYVYTPNVGDCFDRRQLDPPVEQVGRVPSRIVLLLDCTLPHENEIFEVLSYPFAGDEHPGDDALETHARQACPRSFQPYVGRPYEISALEIGYYLPTAAEWEEGARTIGCYLFDVGGDLTSGSMRGSGR